MDYPKALSNKKKRTIEGEGRNIILFLSSSWFWSEWHFQCEDLFVVVVVVSNDMSFLSIDQLNERTNKENLPLLSMCSFVLCFHQDIDETSTLFISNTNHSFFLLFPRKRFNLQIQYSSFSQKISF